MALTLGLGLIGIGRRWGFLEGEPPGEAQALGFLEEAYRLGLRYFDSAPSYGTAEARFGKFLRSLTPAQRGSLTIATKFGEHWDAAGGAPFVDHSFEALRRSLERSLETLGRIDVLQLHKTTPEALASAGVERAWEFAASLGIRRVGPSVSDLESARIACREPRYTLIQLPLNRGNRRFVEVLPDAAAAGKSIVANRPFGMGKILYEAGPERAFAAAVDCFAFLRSLGFDGVVLTGTRSAAHLEANLRAFAASR